MSGRSAYVRKKITETKAGDKAPASASARGRAKSTTSSRSSERDDGGMLSEYPGYGTGYGTTNARFLKFSEPIRETDLNNYRGEITNFSNHSSGSQSGGSDSGQREAATPTPHHNHGGPMQEFAYARARKPSIKTEDVSGIEKSGFRNAIDKRSDNVRKGITKAFTFGRKSKKTDLEIRPASSATVRAMGAMGPSDDDYVDMPPLPVQSAPPEMTSWDGPSGIMSPPPSARLPPIPPTVVTPAIKRWIGAGRPVQRWNKLRKDPELWDPNGDVLVYFGHKGQTPKPNPSFRLSSHIIEATESRFLITLLREGSTEEDILMGPPSPVGAPPMLNRHGMNNNQMLGYGLGRGGQPTPPISEDASLTDADGQISYEMYFPTPPNLTKIDAHRHAITTRNVFALLYHASLVGLSLYQALSDLHARLEEYMPHDADNVGTILNYLVARGIDDARNDAETAVSLLAWCEMAEVRWEEGWREAFLHAAGMYARLDQCSDFRHITPITRALLERACLETQLRVQAAEERLAEFGYNDIWPSSGPIANSPARAAANRLQSFFIAHYTQVYGQWPPTASGATTSDGEEMWLTRTVVQTLQRDFGALYDYLVNRDIIWDESETRSSRKWMMVSESGNRAFDPDTADLPLTDMLIEFDNRLRFPHIPHPYPLVPESIPPTTAGSINGQKLKKGDKEKDKQQRGNDERILERRIQLAYTEATNIYVLGSDFTQSDLIERFVKFEKTDMMGSVDPSAARRGRWVLIYAILQTLASVSVDSPNVRYKDDVAYHLSPRLKGTKTPPWKGVSSHATEAVHELSHCWIVPRTWNSSGESGESDTSVTSGGISPVTQMMMQGQRQHRNFPHPPPTSTSRSSNTAGWHTPATRSVWSAGSGGAPPTMWGGSSAASDDASSSSARTRSNYHHHGSSNNNSNNSNNGYNNCGHARSTPAPKSVRSYATFGQPAVGRVDEDWPVRGQSVRAGSSRSRGPDGPLTISLSPSLNGSGGFLNLEDSPGSRGGRSRDPSTDSGRLWQQQQQQRPILSGGGSDGLGPVIRDFDELDVIDDHEP